jgi:Icc-related predicted phosphoesterase
MRDYSIRIIAFGAWADQILHGRHAGTTAFRRPIETHRPDPCNAGHIQEAMGTDTIGGSPVINPGMLRNGGWIAIRLSPSTLQATLQ